MKLLILLPILLLVAVAVAEDDKNTSVDNISEDDNKKTDKRGLPDAGPQGYGGHQVQQQVLYATAAPQLNYSPAAKVSAVYATPAPQIYANADQSNYKINLAQQSSPLQVGHIQYAQQVSPLQYTQQLAPAQYIQPQISSKVGYAPTISISPKFAYAAQPLQQAQYAYAQPHAAQLTFAAAAQPTQGHITYATAPVVAKVAAAPAQAVYGSYESVQPKIAYAQSAGIVQQAYAQPSLKYSSQGTHGQGAVSYASFIQGGPSQGSHGQAVQYITAPQVGKVQYASQAPQIAHAQPNYASVYTQAPQAQVYASIPAKAYASYEQQQQQQPTYAQIIAQPQHYAASQLSYAALPQLGYAGHQGQSLGKITYVPQVQLAYASQPQVNYAKLGLAQLGYSH